jgi:hypothetical protein
VFFGFKAKMKPVFRATTVEDAPQLTAFLARAFSADPQSEFLRPDLLHWKLWAAREDYSGPRSYVLERDGEIVAHSGIWPLTLETKAGLLRGCHMFDWASDARVLGAGVSILRKVLQMFDFLYANGGSDMTRKIIPSIGFQKVGDVWFAERPIRPLQQTLVRRPLDWKTPARFARNAMRASRPLAAAPEGWSLQEGIGEQEFPSPVAGTVPSALRSLGFLRYLEQCPSAQIRVFQVLKDGRSVGRIALSLVHHQLRVIGTWLSDPSPEAHRAAYHLALRVAKVTDSAFQIVAMGSTPVSERGARAAGLRVDSHTSLLWLSAKASVPAIAFEFQMADNDSIFLP